MIDTFTLDELRDISDALTCRIEQIKKLQPLRRSDNDMYARVGTLIALSRKVAALMKERTQLCSS